MIAGKTALAYQLLAFGVLNEPIIQLNSEVSAITFRAESFGWER